jgi:hypothetical protein
MSLSRVIERLAPGRAPRLISGVIAPHSRRGGSGDPGRGRQGRGADEVGEGQAQLLLELPVAALAEAVEDDAPLAVHEIQRGPALVAV